MFGLWRVVLLVVAAGVRSQLLFAGHFYMLSSQNATWSSASTAAASSTYNGWAGSTHSGCSACSPCPRVHASLISLVSRAWSELTEIECQRNFVCPVAPQVTLPRSPTRASSRSCKAYLAPPAHGWQAVMQLLRVLGGGWLGLRPDNYSILPSGRQANQH
eukprot:m.2428 g.2428  ORF g.2428 m.2428 type:complete len:160 (+) comp2843_c0_seq1:3-482(+)